jgi:hypothetical protein
MKNINNKAQFVQPAGVSTLSLADAVRAFRDITELEMSVLWNWYEIGYAIIVGRFTTKEFLAKVGDNNKTSVSMATAIARFANDNDKFRNKLQDNKFGSLRVAYDAIPNKKQTKPKSNKGKTVSFRENDLVAEIMETFGCTKTQAMGVIRRAGK